MAAYNFTGQPPIADPNKVALLFNKDQGTVLTAPGYGSTAATEYNRAVYEANSTISTNKVLIQPVPQLLYNSLSQIFNNTGTPPSGPSTYADCTWPTASTSIPSSNTNHVLYQDYNNGKHNVYDTNGDKIDHLICYKRLYLYPAQTNKSNAWWFCPGQDIPPNGLQFNDNPENSLLRNCIRPNPQKPSVYTPIVEVYEGGNWVQKNENESGGPGWILDYDTGVLVFYNSPTTLENTYNLKGGSSRDDTAETERCRITFIAYVGKELDDVISGDGTISIDNIVGDGGGGSGIGNIIVGAHTDGIPDISFNTTELYFPKPVMEVTQDVSGGSVFIDICMNEISEEVLNPYLFDVPGSLQDVSWNIADTTKVVAALDVSWNLPLQKQKRLALPLGAAVSKDYKNGHNHVTNRPIKKLPYYRQVKLDYIDADVFSSVPAPEEREPHSDLHPNGYTSISGYKGWRSLTFYNEDVIPTPDSHTHPLSGTTDYSQSVGTGRQQDRVPVTVENIRIYASPHSNSSAQLPRLLNKTLHPNNSSLYSGTAPVGSDMAPHGWFESDPNIIDQAKQYQFRVAIINDQDVADEDAPQYNNIFDPIYTDTTTGLKLKQYWNYSYIPPQVNGKIAFTVLGAPTPPTGFIFDIRNSSGPFFEINNNWSSLVQNIDGILAANMSALNHQIAFIAELEMQPHFLSSFSNQGIFQANRDYIYKNIGNVVNNVATNSSGSCRWTQPLQSTVNKYICNDFTDLSSSECTDLSAPAAGNTNIKWGYYPETLYEISQMFMKNNQTNPGTSSPYLRESSVSTTASRPTWMESAPTGAGLTFSNSTSPMILYPIPRANPVTTDGSGVSQNTTITSLSSELNKLSLIPTRAQAGAAQVRFGFDGGDLTHWVNTSSNIADIVTTDGNTYAHKGTPNADVYSVNSGTVSSSTTSEVLFVDTTTSGVVLKIGEEGSGNSVSYGRYMGNPDRPSYPTASARLVTGTAGSYVPITAAELLGIQAHTKDIVEHTTTLKNGTGGVVSGFNVTVTAKGLQKYDSSGGVLSDINDYPFLDTFSSLPSLTTKNGNKSELEIQDGYYYSTGSTSSTAIDETATKKGGYYLDYKLTTLELHFDTTTVQDMQAHSFNPYKYQTQETYYTNASSSTTGITKNINLNIAHRPTSNISLTGYTLTPVVGPNLDVYFQGLKLPANNDIGVDQDFTLDNVSLYWRKETNCGTSKIYYSTAEEIDSLTHSWGTVTASGSANVGTMAAVSTGPPTSSDLTSFEIMPSKVWLISGMTNSKRYSRNLVTSNASSTVQFKCNFTSSGSNPGHSGNITNHTIGTDGHEIKFVQTSSSASSSARKLWWDTTWSGGYTSSVGYKTVSTPYKPLNMSGSSLFALTKDSSYTGSGSGDFNLQELSQQILITNNNSSSSVSIPTSVTGVTHTLYDHRINRSDNNLVTPADAAQMTINKHQLLYANGAFRTNWTTSSKNKMNHDFTQWFQKNAGDLYDYSVIQNGSTSGIGDKTGDYTFVYNMSISSAKFWNNPSTSGTITVGAQLQWLCISYTIPATSSASGQATYELILEDDNGTPIPKSTISSANTAANGYWLYHYIDNKLYNGQLQTDGTGNGCYQRAISTTKGADHYSFQKSTSASKELFIYIGIPRDQVSGSSWDGSIGRVEVKLYLT